MPADEQAAAGPQTALPRPPRRLERLFRWYVGRAAVYSNRRFIIEMFVLSFLLKIAGAVPSAFLADYVTNPGQVPEGMPVAGYVTNPGQVPEGMPVLVFIAMALTLSPILETVVFQWFVIWLTSLFAAKLTWKIGVSALVFALVHAPYGLLYAWAVFFPGVVFATGFVIKRRESRWRAFWVTAAIHALHNAVAVPLMLIVPVLA